MQTNTALKQSAGSAAAMAALRMAALAAGLAGAGWAQAAVVAPGAAARPPVAVAQGEPCRNCGVVESVVRVQRPGQTKGIAGSPVTPGMAIGGVVGGLLGNQFGHGTGRTAMTVAGAAGGAYAGNAIEKNRAKRTAYVMHIRMADGSRRTIEQSVALRKGSHVVVEGKTARLARTRNRAQG
jgi:outer membrane lipoprotein SlyB